ncbi:hypothetical protein QTN47_11825 [Danxiaibacter flavus]|uniref:Galactose oxidase n=1 Tax=Danxiaibacter flavus TaxID=3049108 RepID=A0ABV3ZF28_9BACT|nr:hypothetical protein QNM32_11830 [Chitinophagaceae bacterium DXS]
MARYIFCTLILLALKLSCFGQSYGLLFNSHEVVLEKRTSLDVSPGDSICLDKNFQLEFQFNFIPNHAIYFGYIFRLISNNSQNVDLIYDQPSSSFRLIAGENFAGITFTIDSLLLYKKWNKIAMNFDREKHILQCSVNNKTVGSGKLPQLGSCFKFLWGANDYLKFKTRDIPPMQVKDIRISENNTQKYFWPLDETSGDICYDKINHKAATVKNPVWIKPRYQRWENAGSLTMNGYAGVAYDAKTDKLYITGSDSVYTYSFKSGIQIDGSASKHQNFLVGHQEIYDTLNNRLLDVYLDSQKVTSYDFNGQHWSANFPSGHVAITRYWHANKFISPADSSLYMIGGYGYLRYKNLVKKYDFNTKQWDSIVPGGDYFTPRYLAALGTDAAGKHAYIIGGYGSQTGDQMLDPKYYYDFFRFDVRDKSFKKLYTFKPSGEPFTFANSLVIDEETNSYYGLLFPNDSFNSKLQLLRGSLKDSSFTILGTSIPYSFHDVQSFADLYYSPVNNRLIAVTMFYTPEDVKEQRTEVKIYTLNFPPEPLDAVELQNAAKGSSKWIWILAGALIIALGLIAILKRRRVTTQPQAQNTDTPPVVTREETLPAISLPQGQSHNGKKITSTIYLFGQFQVFDKEGNDVTKLFTPLLKELFLIISIYTIHNGRGISSQGLNEILWYDKSIKDAKNNRSVNIAKLKGILEKIGDCVINKESGYWQIQNDNKTVHIDYEQYAALLQNTSLPPKEYMALVSDIIKRGSFLSQTEYNWLDNIKSDISNSVIDICVGFIKTQDISKEPEFIIEVTNYIFHFDQLNEDALIYKCKCFIQLKRHTLANNSYLKFIKDYKDIYGEDFSKSFHDVIA